MYLTADIWCGRRQIAMGVLGVSIDEEESAIMKNVAS